MADHEIAAFDEAAEDLKTPQGSDRYIAKKETHFEQPVTTDSTIDGRDIAVDGALLDTATQPGDLGTAAAEDVGYFADAAQGALADTAIQPADNVSDLTNDAGYEPNEDLADQPEAEAGVENTKTMTALRVAQAILAQDTAVQNKYDAVTAPITTNDDSEGYAVGSVWIVVTGGSEAVYICTDPTTNVAIWVNLALIDDDGTAILNKILLTPITAPAYQEGLNWYDDDRKLPSSYTNFPDITLNHGEELWAPIVINNTGSLIPDGTPVYKSGTSGGLAEITPAIADGYRIYGITTHDIVIGAQGRVTLHGSLSGPDFSSFGPNDTLYLSTVTPGLIVNTAPVYPNKAIELGTVLANTNPGAMMVDIEHHSNANVVIKSYNFSSRTASSGQYYLAGYYDVNAADMNLTNGAPAGTHGDANNSYAAHVFIVFGAATTDGTIVTLTASGTSMTDNGVRTGADSEVLYTGPVAGLTVHDYLETTLKFLGTVTFTLTSDGATFTMDFNYGLCKYEDFNNLDATLRTCEFVGLADAGDSGFNIEIFHHSDQGWQYSAAAFAAGGVLIGDMNSDHVTEKNLVAGEHFAWKRTNFLEDLQSAASEGLVIRVTTSVNNSVAYMNGHLTAVTA